MKKLFLLFAFIGLLFVFTGCDEILEALYPEFTIGEEGVEGEEAVKVEVWLDYSIRYNTPEYFDSIDPSPVKVKLVPFQMIGQDQWYIDWGANSPEQELYKEQFDQSDDQDTAKALFFNPGYSIYRAIVWFDLNNDGQIGYDEPSMQAVDEHGNVQFDLTYYRPGDPTVELSADLDKNTRINETWIITELAGEQTGENEPPIASIFVQNDNVPQGTDVHLIGWDSWDPDGWIEEYVWTVQDALGEYVEYGDNIHYTFNQQGRWNVRLEVRDNNGAWSEMWVAINVGPPQSGTNKKVEVNVDIDYSIPNLGNTLRVVLVQTDGGHFDGRDFWNQRYPVAWFEWIPDGWYLVAGWLDLNEDGFPDPNEPGNVGYPNYAPFTPDIDLYSEDFVQVNLSIDSGSRIPEEYIPEKEEGEGSPDEPFELFLDTPHDSFVDRDVVNFYYVDVDMGSEYTVHLFNMDGDNDLEVSESWQTSFPGNHLGGSAEGGTMDEWFTVQVWDEYLLIEVFGYEGGNFTIEVFEETGGGGPPVGSPDNPDPIGIGALVTGDLPFNGEWYYSVPVTPGTIYEVSVSGLTGGIDVYQNWEPRVNWNNWLDGGNGSVIVVPSTVYLVIGVYADQPSTFNLEVFEAIGGIDEGTPENPEPISINTPINGAMNAYEEWYYAVPVTFGTTYTITLTNLDGDIDFDVYENSIAIIDWYNWVDGSWNGGSDNESVTITAYDDYFIIALESWDSSGYTLQISD
jgi:hypothetical protein